VKQLMKMRAKDEPIDAFVSLTSRYASHITATMIDPTGTHKTLFEQLLKHVPEDVRAEFVDLKGEYAPPEHLRFLGDKKELEIELKRRANNYTPDDVERFISDKPSQGGGEGNPPWEDECWAQLIADMAANTRHLSNDVEKIVTPGAVSSPDGDDCSDVDESELIPSLDANYVNLSVINLGQKMAQVGAVSVSDSPIASDMEIEAGTPQPDGPCSYPLCTEPEGVKKRMCGLHRTNGCTDLLHHLCASTAGEDRMPPRCFSCMMSDMQSTYTQSDAQLSDDAPIPSQKHLVDTNVDGGSEASDSDGSHVPGTQPDDEPAVLTPQKQQPEPMATTPVTPRPDQCVRISPAASRSPKPSNATNKLYGADYGVTRDVPRDNSCFYHSVRELVLCDPDLRCDMQSLELIGENTTDLRKNIKAICDGKSDNTAFDEVNVGELVFDLRIGAPPPEQSAIDPMERYHAETLDDLAAGAADVESLAAYGKKVAKKDASGEMNFWGTEVDLCLVAAGTDRVWQFGNVDPRGCFCPSVQATPVDYDFTRTEDPLRMEHTDNGTHYQPFFGAEVTPEGFAAVTDVESDAEVEEGKRSRHLCLPHRLHLDR
jgi:hypothetical protein